MSDADEPFLERALDDRSKEVRQDATELLATLPGSAFVARMTARAAGLLHFKKGGLLSRNVLEVTLPEEPDAAGLRDGLDPKGPHGQRTFGEKAALLVQTLAAVPLSHWTTAFRQTPGALIQALKKNDFAQAVVTGWTLATLRQRDPAWAEALLEAPAEWQPSRDWLGPGALLTVLSDEARTRQLANALRGGALERQDAWTDLQALLLSFQPFLPVPVAQDLLHAWRRLAAKGVPWHLQHLQGMVALKIPPRLLPFALDDWPTPNPAASLVETLSFRHEAFAALAQP